MKRLVSGILAALLAVTAFSACNTNSPASTGSSDAASGDTSSAEASSGDAQTPITIQFWTSFTGPDGEYARDITKRFNEQDNGITVEFDAMGADILTEKLATALSTDNAPDLVFQFNLQVGLHGKNGTMRDLSDFWEKTGVDESDFVENSITALQYEGKQIMLPFHWYSTYLYWNKDLFEAAGLDPETPPKTWDEVYTMAEQLTDPSKNVYGIGLPTSGAVPWFYSIMRSNGGEFFDTENMKSLLDDQANLDTLKWIQDIAQKGFTPANNTGADLDNVMMADQLAMYVNGPWLSTGLRDNEINFGVTGMPAGSKTTIGVAEEYGFCVPKDTPDANVDAAYKYMAYWYTPEIASEWCLKNGYPPFMKSLVENEDIKNDEYVNIFSQMQDYGEVSCVGLTTGQQIQSDVLFPMVENIMAGNDAQAELTKASDEVDKILATE